MSVSRASLPEEFFDITSAQLLAQPEPQYLYALLFKQALALSLESEGIGLPGRQSPDNGGGYRPAEADRYAMARMLPESVFAVKADFKGGPGHTMKFNRPQFANTTYTEASRLIATGTSISTTPIDIGSEQVSLTVKRYGGPYDQTNSRVAPFAIEAFDATMGVHSLARAVGEHLGRDFDKFLDAVYTVILNNGSTTIYPDGISADNDMVTADHPLTYEQISRTAKSMDKADLPRLPDGRRLLVCTPDGKKQLRDDPQFAAYAKENKETNPLFPGWFGSDDEFHYMCSNTLTATDNSSSIEIHSAHAIAPGALMGGVGRPPRVRPSTDDNYGETPKVIWLSDLAMGLADNRFVQVVKYAEDA